MDETEDGYHQQEIIDQYELLKKDIRLLNRQLGGINSIKQTDPKFLSKIEKYVENLPDDDDFQLRVKSIKKRLNDIIVHNKTIRIKEFSNNLNKFIISLQEKGVPHRIIDSANIRVNCIEIIANHQNGQARILYNKSVVLPWQDVYSASDIQKMCNEANIMLKRSELPEATLSTIFSSAYQNIRIRQVNKKINPDMVLLEQLHQETIIELLRLQFKGKFSCDRKFKEIYFPKWAFLYNLDRYRVILPNLPESQKLQFQTGSQAETEKYGIILNGLIPTQDYKKYCFIKGK